jgi:hypothetical protein
MSAMVISGHSGTLLDVRFTPRKRTLVESRSRESHFERGGRPSIARVLLSSRQNSPMAAKRSFK